MELVAEGLEMRIDELNNKAFQAKKPIQISSQCSIFAESEVISYKNEGANIPDLVAGVCNSVAGRIYPLIRMIDKQTKKVAFSGGVAKNKYIAENLEERLGFKLVKLSLEPEYIAAYGAAIIAKEAELGVNAGHDLNLDNLRYLVKNIPWLMEVSIGHALISDAIYMGLENTIKLYKSQLTG